MDHYKCTHVIRLFVLQALHDTFVAFGNVLSCKVATDEHGRSKGYGFVHYETAEAADNAIKSVNGMLLNDKKVYVGHHISRKVDFTILCEAYVYILPLGTAIQARRNEGAVHQPLYQESGYRSNSGRIYGALYKIWQCHLLARGHR